MLAVELEIACFTDVFDGFGSVPKEARRRVRVAFVQRVASAQRNGRAAHMMRPDFRAGSSREFLAFDCDYGRVSLLRFTSGRIALAGHWVCRIGRPCT
jgi:hypothetical protein